MCKCVPPPSGAKSVGFGLCKQLCASSLRREVGWIWTLQAAAAAAVCPIAAAAAAAAAARYARRQRAAIRLQHAADKGHAPPHARTQAPPLPHAPWSCWAKGHSPCRPVPRAPLAPPAPAPGLNWQAPSVLSNAVAASPPRAAIRVPWPAPLAEAARHFRSRG